MNEPTTSPSSALAVTESGSRLQKFTTGDVEAGLHLLALNNGNAKKTSEQLRAEGRSISAVQLRKWKDTDFARRYHELAREIDPEVSNRAATQAMEMAQKASDAEATYIQMAHERIGDIEDASKLATAARQLSQIKSGNIETARLLREKPTSISEQRNPAELLKILQDAGVLKPSQETPRPANKGARATGH